jgi:hypothetical protein
MPDLNQIGISLVSKVTVSHASAAATTLFTVPYGVNGSTLYFAWDHTKIIAAGDETATDITLGRSTALTDFMGTTQLDNLDAQYDMVKVQPIQADPPVKQKVYPSGTILQVDVTAANGNAGNIYLTYGTYVSLS